MCYNVDSYDFIFSYFIYTQTESVSLKQLENKKDEIQNELDNVYISLNKESISRALFYYKESLSSNNETIYFKKRKLNKKTREILNNSLPTDIRNKFIHAISI